MSRGNTFAAQLRRQERDIAIRRRELAAQAKEHAAWQAEQRARHEVSVYENHRDFVLSMHKDCGPTWDCREVASRRAPEIEYPLAPIPARAGEAAARAALSTYRPSFLEKLFGGEKKRREQLEAGVLSAQQQDAQTFAAAREAHAQSVALAEADYRQRRERHDWEQALAGGVLRGDLGAYQTVLAHLSPFAELEDSGMGVALATLRTDVAVLRCTVADESIIPREEKKLTAAGKLSTKALPAGTYWALYQDYVCGCALRVAREMFALLPLPRVVVNVTIAGLDTSTGHDAHIPILAVSIPREIAEGLNYDALDPSDSLTNFAFRMKFKKTTGFDPVEPISADESFITSGRGR